MTEIAIRSADVEIYQPAAGSLALRADQDQWTDQQRAGLVQLGIDKASQGDLDVFRHVCQRTGLDPFSRQIYMIARGGKWTIQTGIDGFRVIADRRPEYAGQVEPQWCGDDGQWRDIWLSNKPPTAARVGVLRSDWQHPAWGVVRFAEFTAGNSMWKDKPAHMIAKVAEAHAFRKAFPHDFAGLLVTEETDRDSMPVRGYAHQAQAVTITELTGGTPVPPPSTAAAPAAGHMSQEKQQQLLAAMRESDVDDRWGWASGVLGRDVSSYGQLSDTDADRLIADLQQDGAS